MAARRMAICILAALLPPAAAAQEQGGPGACRNDTQKFCVAAQGDREKRIDCLIDHQQEITDGCYSFLKTSLERQRGTQDARPPIAAATAPPHTIYKVKGADGRTVYTNAPVGNYSSVQEVKLDRVIDSVPLGSSAR